MLYPQRETVSPLVRNVLSAERNGFFAGMNALSAERNGFPAGMNALSAQYNHFP
jgi:hypothetical protein